MLFFIIFFFFASFALGMDENRWIKLDDHCVRPYGFSAPILCFEYDLPDDVQLVLVPQFSTTTPSTTTTSTIESVFDDSNDELTATLIMATTTQTNTESVTFTTTTETTTMTTQIFKSSIPYSTLTFIAIGVCITLLLMIIGVIIAYKVSLLNKRKIFNKSLKCGKKRRPNTPIRPPPPVKKNKDGFEEVPLYETVPEPSRINLNFPDMDNRVVFGRGFTLRTKESWV